MVSDKLSGTYYTPPDAIQFMIEYLKREQQDFSNVLEPSAGDGRFLPLLQGCAEHITAIELFQEKVDNMNREYAGDSCTIVKDNFLDFAVSTLERYSLIIGNPPYINKKLMKEDDIEKARNICVEAGLKETVMQNMWLAFVVGACRLLQPGGSIFFVLPGQNGSGSPASINGASAPNSGCSLNSPRQERSTSSAIKPEASATTAAERSTSRSPVLISICKPFIA